MESENVILALAALAQPTRLEVFRLLVEHEPKGLAAGDIARALAGAVVLFMLRDCCDGRPEICAPLIEDLTPCCPPKPKRKAQTHV